MLKKGEFAAKEELRKARDKVRSDQGPTVWRCANGCQDSEVEQFGAPDYPCFSCGEANWSQPRQGLALDPRQDQIIALLSRIGAVLGGGLVKRMTGKMDPGGPLSAGLYDSLRTTAGSLQALTSQAFPENILEPDILGVHNARNHGVIDKTLNAAVEFLTVVATIMESDEFLVLVSVGLNDMLFSPSGKNCITSAGADLSRMISSGTITKSKKS